MKSAILTFKYKASFKTPYQIEGYAAKKEKKKWEISSLVQMWGQSINFSSLFISKLSAVIKPKLPFEKATFLKNID